MAAARCTGWSMPCWRSESARAAISAGSKERRGWNGLGSISSTETWSSSAALDASVGSRPPEFAPQQGGKAASQALRLFTVEDLHDEFGVGPGAPRDRGAYNPGRISPWLGDSLMWHVAWHHRLGRRRLVEVFSRTSSGHFIRQFQRRVVHRQHDPADFEPLCYPGPSSASPGR